MQDGYQRTIHYLRVSVTDRCNFRCKYCMPPEGISWIPHADILSYEELLRLIRVFGGEGITSVRLTGGEPLVRKGIVDFIAGIKNLGFIRDLSLTTNGSLLPQMAARLKTAGLDRVNISLDTLDPERFAKLTGGGSLADTLQGIDSALAEGLTPVKLNVVITEALEDSDLAYFAQLVESQPIAVRFIECMPLGGEAPARILDAAAVAARLEHIVGRLEAGDSGAGSGPAQYYRFPGAVGTIGFITPITDHFCGVCNRVRLTADGRLKPCLLSDSELDIKQALRGGASDEELAAIFRAAVASKPEGHSLCRTSGHTDFRRHMSQIGG